MYKATLETFDESGRIVKKKKLDFWCCQNEDPQGITISLNSLDENPTKEGYGREIYIKLSTIRKALAEKGFACSISKS